MITKDYQLAEDAVQETFLLVLQKFPQLAALPPEDVAARNGAAYDREKGVFLLPYFGREYEVERNGRIFCAGQNDVPYNDRVIIVQYLCQASGLPPRGRWLSFLELPDGSHHYAPLQTDATIPLAKRFGQNRGGFFSAQSNILFDAVAPTHLSVPPFGCWALSWPGRCLRRNRARNLPKQLFRSIFQ